MVLDLLTKGLTSATGLSITSRGLLVVRETEAPAPPGGGGVVGGGTPTEGAAFSLIAPVSGARKVDVRLVSKVDAFGADFSILGGDFESDNGFGTALLLSLFTDRRASKEELDDFGGDDARGWWGDSVSEFNGDLFGSKLWLLARRKQTPQTLEFAKQWTREAVQWFVDDGLADQILVEGEYPRRRMLGLQLEIDKARAPRERWAFVWEF